MKFLFSVSALGLVTVPSQGISLWKNLHLSTKKGMLKHKGSALSPLLFLYVS